MKGIDAASRASLRYATALHWVRYVWFNALADFWCMAHPTWQVVIVTLWDDTIHVCAKNAKDEAKVFGIVAPLPNEVRPRSEAEGTQHPSSVEIYLPPGSES